MSAVGATHSLHADTAFWPSYQGATGVSIPDATVRPRKHAATVVEAAAEEEAD